MKARILFLFLLVFTCSFGQKLPEVAISGVGAYPNPFNEQLFVQHTNIEDDDKIQKMEIYSESGNLVLSVNRSNVVETSRIPNGMYLLKIYYSDQVIVRKVLKK